MGDERAGRGTFLALAAITTITAVVSSLGAPLIPEIAADADVPLTTAQWALTATLVTAAATTPAIGRWASGRLRRPVILGGLVLVLIGTVLSALPLGLGVLIGGRALQGVGLALVPLALAVARDLWDGPLLVSRMALLSVTAVAGAGLGYPVTAFTAAHFGVSGAYWFGTFLVAATLLLAVRHLPVASDGVPQHVDLLGVALLSTGTIAVLLAISRGEVWGWSSTETLGTGVGGLVLVIVWIGWTLRPTLPERPPLVDLRLAGRAGLRAPNVVTFTIGVGMYGLLTLVVVLVQSEPHDGLGLGLGVGVAGLILVPYSVASVSGNRLAREVAARIGPQVLLPVGCTTFAASMAVLALWHDHLWQALIAMGIGGLGSGFTFSSLPLLIVPKVPVAETGSAMAFNQLLRYLGFAVGAASSVALLDVLGADDTAFTATLLVLAGLCLVTGAGAALGGRLVRAA
ncbi:MFS transporter [Nocardioides caeni]|uniref:MFS transporter n=1 Tax=Nocardioides caeni TaxID=574700 RepID=A0A4S8N8V2_9ACTN|nr:MFS transporter [Nocardioides caeni]THV12152.1 MFS transporter [Nocardioides caeni]